MSKIFSKCLGEIALMAAAAMWTGCGDVDKKADESTESQKVQERSTKAISGTRGRLEPILDEDKGLGDSLLYGLLYGSGGGIIAKTKGEVQVPQESDIVIEKGYNLDERSVLKTIRQRTPGLRHIYNKNLKKKPGFNGTVVLKLKVDEQGTVENIVLDSSTTGYEEFDNDVTLAVSRWIFEKKKVRGTFKIPFTFYEKE